MGTTYYVRVRGRVSGPFSVKQLRELKSRGRFCAFHEVSRDGDEWESATSLGDVFESSPSNGDRDIGVTELARKGAPRAVPNVTTCPPAPMPNEAYEHGDSASVDRKSPKGRQIFVMLIALLLVACGVGGFLVLQDVQERQRRDPELVAQQERDDRDRKDRKAKEPQEPPERDERRRQEDAEKAAKASANLADKQASLARQYAERAGKQIMERIGGGQDLVVNQERSTFDSFAKEYVIDMEIAFNGAIVRSNRYTVCGRLIVREDGTNPRFSRTSANSNFTKQEKRLLWVGGAIVLYELSQER